MARHCFYQIKDSAYTDRGLKSNFFSILGLLLCYKYETINPVDIFHSRKGISTQKYRSEDQNSHINNVTCYQSLGKISCFFYHNINQKSIQIQKLFLILFCTNVTQMSMLTNCIMTNLMICENLDLLSLCVLQIIRILLAFSDFPTYSEKVLLPKFPLLGIYLLKLYDCFMFCHKLDCQNLSF